MLYIIIIRVRKFHQPTANCFSTARKKPLGGTSLNRVKPKIIDYRKKGGLELNVIVVKYNQEFDNGPTQSGVLQSPVGIACRKSSVLIAEHPTDRQGSIRLFQYLAGLRVSVDITPG